MKMSPDTFSSLVKENKKWLIENTDDCLERQHIFEIMDDSVKSYARKETRRDRVIEAVKYIKPITPYDNGTLYGDTTTYIQKGRTIEKINQVFDNE